MKKPKFNENELKDKMTEIKKITKIALIWYGVAGILFAFVYLVLTDLYIAIIQWPYNDPVMFWSLGGTLLILGIGYLMAFFRKEWEEMLPTDIEFLNFEGGLLQDEYKLC